MKSRKLWLGILAMTLVFGTMLTGCKTDVDAPTYTVWTDTVTYSEFTTGFPAITLEDGYYIRVEFTNPEWSEISPSLTDEGKNSWTEYQIKNWFIGCGFGNTEANQETAWLITTNHGFIACRTGSLVYMILK